MASKRERAKPAGIGVKRGVPIIGTPLVVPASKPENLPKDPAVQTVAYKGKDVPGLARDITGRVVTIYRGGLEIRTARKGCAGWPYLPWMFRPNGDVLHTGGSFPSELYLEHEKGEIMGATEDAEYTVGPISRPAEREVPEVPAALPEKLQAAIKQAAQDKAEAAAQREEQRYAMRYKLLHGLAEIAMTQGCQCEELPDDTLCPACAKEAARIYKNLGLADLLEKAFPE